MKKVKTLRWRTKLFLLFSLLSVGPMVAVTIMSSQASEESYRASLLDYLAGLARAKGEAIDQFMELRRVDVERQSAILGPYVVALKQSKAAADLGPEPAAQRLPILKDAEELGESGGEGAPPMPATTPAAAPPSAPLPHTDEASPTGVVDARRALRQALAMLRWDQREFEELLVIDSEGRVLASTFEGHEGTSAASLEYFKLGRKATYVQPVFLSPITNQLTMVISTPIRTEGREDVGVFAARLNLKRFFRLINDSTGLGMTGETVAGKKIDRALVFMAPTRHDLDAALGRKIPLDQPEARPLQEAVSGRSGNGAAIDYRGTPVFAAWQPVPSLDWGLVVKIDREEALTPSRILRRKVWWIALGVILLALVISLFAAAALVRPLRQLKVATDRISRGDFDVDIDIRRGDEVGDLADSFERMIAATKFFRENARTDDDDDIEDEVRSSEGE